MTRPIRSRSIPARHTAGSTTPCRAAIAATRPRRRGRFSWRFLRLCSIRAMTHRAACRFTNPSTPPITISQKTNAWRDGASPGMNYRLLFAIVSTAFVEQAVITIVRVAPPYPPVELDLSVVWLGVITAVYALLPIAIGVPIGRFIDRGYDAVTTWIGGGLLIVGCAGFVLFPNLPGILVATATIGTAHLLFVVSQQVLCTRCGTGPGAMERAIGKYMVANAMGQGVGPYIVGLAGGSASVPPTKLLFLVSLGGAVLTAACALFTRSTGAHKVAPDSVRAPLRELLFIPGLTAIMLVSVVTVVGQDLIVVYLPLLGADRGWSVDAVGTLLAVRAIASMLSRLSFARLHVAFGRIR